ncbi:MAG: ABC transporter substrate-binding protein [Actinomycetota bacterium]
MLLRRTTKRLAAAALVALTIAACGSSGDDGSADTQTAATTGPGSGSSTTASTLERSTTTASTSTSTTTTTDPRVNVDEVTQPDDAADVPDAPLIDPADFPRSVTHNYGTVEIPSAPQRIVAAAGVTDLDALLSLGVVPYATSLYYPVNFDGDLGLPPWNVQFAPELITLPREAAIEEFARLEPDLIVGQPGQLTDSFDIFNDIAPTVIHEYPTPWQDPLRLFGDALGLEDEAEQAIADIQAEIDALAERVPDDPPSIAMIGSAFGQVTVYNENLGAGPARVMQEVGIPVIGPDGPISFERLEELADADYIIVFDFTLDPVDELLDNPIFGQLPAVQAGNVVQLSPEQSFSWVIETSRSIPPTIDGILTEIGL